MGQREEWLRQLDSMRHGGATGVALTTRGKIRMKPGEKHWRDFTAEEVIVAGRGFVWSGEVSIGGVLVHGWDGCLELEGAMEWQALGLVKIARLASDDISRSARARLAVATMLVPGWAAKRRVRESDDLWSCEAADHRVELRYRLGQLKDVRVVRWGHPEGFWRDQSFGFEVDSTELFQGVRLPASYRMGWWIGTDRWEDGQFLHAEVVKADVW